MEQNTAIRPLSDGLVLLLLYAAAALIVRFLFGDNEVVRFQWIVAGPAIYYLVIHGYAILGVCLTGAIIGNLLFSAPLDTACWNSFQNVIMIGIGVYSFKETSKDALSFKGIIDYARLFGTAVIMGCAAIAIISVQVWPKSSIWNDDNLIHVCTGTGFGFILSMIPILVWRNSSFSFPSRRMAVEFALISGLSFFVGQVVFCNYLHDTLGQVARGYWMFLFITISALRLGAVGTTIILLIIAAQALSGALLHIGFFSTDIEKTHLTNYYSYMICLSSDGFLVAMLFAQGEQHRKRLAEALVELLRFRDALDHVPAYIYIKDRHGRYVYANRNTLDLFSCSSEELAGKDDTAFFLPETACRIKEIDARVFAGNRSSEEIHTLGFASGERVYLEIKSPIYVDGEPDVAWGLCGVSTDITDRIETEKAVRQSEARLRALVTAGNQMIYRMSADWKIMYELRGQTLLVDTAEPIENWPDIYLLPDDRPIIFEHIERSIANKTMYELEHRVRRDDGSVGWVLSRAAPIIGEGGEITEWFGAAADVTARKRSEELLRAAKQEAERANAAKSQFLANMSHELRTPLNAIMGFSRLLAEQNDDPVKREWLDVVIASGKSLLSLIQDILDLSRIEAGKVDNHNVDFNVLAEMNIVESLFRQRAITNHIEFCVKVPEQLDITLHGQSSMLRQVLINLLDNAFKFTKQGSTEVSVEVSDAGHSHQKGAPITLLFQVIDTGVGIRQENHMRIFDRFEQEDSSMTKRFGGAGLGLAISKRLVSLMGGQIWLESSPNVGSRFSFTAMFHPVQSAGDDETALSQSEGTGRHDINVLVVEDDLISRTFFATVLNMEGYTTVTAKDGAQAITFLEQGAFDIVLMDIQLPDISGVEITHLIRQGSLGNCDQTMPVIAVTAYAMANDRERFLSDGMTDYLSKPIDTDLLKKLILRHRKQKAV